MIHNNGVGFMSLMNMNIAALIFGLYRTTVGMDTGNDMLENIVTYEEQAKIKEEELKKAEEESRSIEQERLVQQAKKANEELKAKHGCIE